jgi:hypothetical protein
MSNWLVGTSIDHYIHATRWLLFACMFGLMIMWPAMRLSQEIDPRLAPSQILWDWFSLNLAFQVVIWPMKVSAQWNTAQTLWLDAAMAVWSLLVGVVLAWAMRRGTGRDRIAGMVICVLICFGEPAIAALLSMTQNAGNTWHWPILLSPIETLILLTANPPMVAPIHILGIAMLAMAGWLTLGASLRHAD